MAARRITFKITTGPNAGDALGLEAGSCRLIGRHLSDNETALIDRDGNRVLDGSAAEIITGHLKEKSPPVGVSAKGEFSADTFERGPDIILSDDSISRAHAMVFSDGRSVGVIDLASTNGTYVNDERISTTVIQDGDSVTLGNSELTVTIR